MNCKHCDNKLVSDAKFCNKCGKPVEAKRPKVDIKKIKKSLENTGKFVYAIGWITIIINPGIYLWSVLDKNFAESGLPAIDLSGTFLMIVVAIIFIIFGNRIRGLVDKNIKLYLQILLGFSILLLVLALSTGGRVGILFFLVVAYLISSLVSIYKAMKVEEFTATLTSPKYKLDKKGWIIFAVVAVVIFFVTVGIDLSTQENSDYLLENNSTQTQNSNSNSKADIISETVKKIKAEMSLPNQIDETTLLVDITAEPNAIRYQYVISGIDTSQLSNSYLKSFLGSSICENADTKNLLNYGINMEYSYTVKSSTQKYFVSFTKNDCS